MDSEKIIESTTPSMETPVTNDLLTHITSTEPMEPVVPKEPVKAVEVVQKRNEFKPTAIFNPNYIKQSTANARQNVYQKAQTVKSAFVEKQSFIKRSVTFIVSMTFLVLIIILFYAANTPSFSGHDKANLALKVVGYIIFSGIMLISFTMACYSIAPAYVKLGEKFRNINFKGLFNRSLVAPATSTNPIK